MTTGFDVVYLAKMNPAFKEAFSQTPTGQKVVRGSREWKEKFAVWIQHHWLRMKQQSVIIPFNGSSRVKTMELSQNERGKVHESN